MEELSLVKNQIKEYIQECGDQKSCELLGLLAQGKMLRSKLILKIAGVNDNSIKLCAVVEMIHAASLLHDDVIDESDTRRGKPSINALFDNKTAIMFGDILYSKAFTELSQMDKKIAHTVSSAVTLLSIGEMLDVDLTNNFNTSYDKYFDMIYKKTASLIEAAAFCAAFIAKKDTAIYELYGRNLGLAFQVIDDVLDITSSSEVLGKPALNDFKEGKTTLPYLYMYEELNEKDKAKLLTLFGISPQNSDVLWIKEKFSQSAAVAKSIQLAKNLGQEALDAIKDENAPDLEKIIKEMIVRDF